MAKEKKLDRSGVTDGFTDSIAGVLHAARDVGFSAEEVSDIIARAALAVDQERAITAAGKCSKCEIEKSAGSEFARRIGGGTL